METINNKLTLDVQQLSIIIDNLDEERLKDALYWLQLDLDAADIRIEEKEEISKLCQLIQDSLDERVKAKKRMLLQEAEQNEEFEQIDTTTSLTGQPLSRISYYGHTMFGKIGVQLHEEILSHLNFGEPVEKQFYQDPDLGDIVFIQGKWYFWSKL